MESMKTKLQLKIKIYIAKLGLIVGLTIVSNFDYHDTITIVGTPITILLPANV